MDKKEENQLTMRYLYDLIKKQRKEIEQIKIVLFQKGILQ